MRPNPKRAPIFLCALCVFFSAYLTGCASKNPLIDESATASSVSSANKPTSIGVQKAVPSAKESEKTGTQTTGPDTGFKRFLGIFTPHRFDIQQGNFISHEMVALLKEGMTPDQVRFALGTPLLTDIFHADRWEYIFRLQKSNGEIITSRVTLLFKDNRLARIDSGNLPNEIDYLALIAGKISDPESQNTKPAENPNPTPAAK